MIQRVPELVDKGVGQLNPCRGVGGEIGDQLNDPLHDHGFVVDDLLASKLRADQVVQRLEVWKIMFRDQISVHSGSGSL